MYLVNSYSMCRKSVICLLGTRTYSIMRHLFYMNRKQKKNSQFIYTNKSISSESLLKMVCHSLYPVTAKTKERASVKSSFPPPPRYSEPP